MHTMSPRLIWALLIPANDSVGRLPDASCSSEELINMEFNVQRLSLSHNMAMFTLAPSHVIEILPCIITAYLEV